MAVGEVLSIIALITEDSALVRIEVKSIKKIEKSGVVQL